ncbi:MAG: DUF3426 domain-containing protein [Spongiibacteraceae bacterium]
MDHRITQCPRCGTSFRVTEAHLAVAAGAVRCGSCLHIFNARDHWADSKPAAPEPEKPLAQKKIDEIEIGDDELIDDDSPIFDDDEPEPAAKTKGGIIFNAVDEDFEVIDDGGPEKLSESFLDINSWEEESGHSFRNERIDTDEDDESNEAAWTQKLLEDDEEKVESAIKAPARSDVFDEFDSVLDAVPEIEDDEPEDNKPSTKNDDFSAEFSAEFLNIDADNDRPARAPMNDSAATSTLAIDTEPNEPATTAGEPTQPLFALRDIEQEPIRLHQFVHESRWPKILWSSAFVGVLALSVWQYIHFNFAELARGSLRPWLAQACNLLDCVLPPQFDVTQVRTNSLIVRSHPTQRAALAVDAIITNQADFPQPYPVLQLQFSDLNGAPVAGRRFLPSEYLSGELTGARLMPVQQPVHIALEIVDPGSRAVNYQLSVVAPDLAE